MDLIPHRAQREPQPSRAKWLSKALHATSEGKSTFTEADLLRSICNLGLEVAGADADMALELLDQALCHSQEIARLGSISGMQRFTTRSNLESEREILALASANHAAPVVSATPGELQGRLNDEQVQVLETLFTSQSRVFAISGLAGTGKTSLLQAANREYSRSGIQVVGAAVTGKAADGLELESGIPSATLASLLIRERSTSPSLKRGSVLVVDEASMVSTSQMLELLQLVAERSAKCVLVGDAAQLPPIGSGCPFALIADATGAASLGEIVRQKDAAFRHAVRAASNGLSGHVLAFLESNNSMIVEPTVTAARSRLVRDWFAAHGSEPKNGLMLAATNAAVLNLNLQAQHERRLAGLVWGSEVPLPGSSFLLSGDRVLFKRNDRALHVRNGNLGTVLNTEPGLEVLLDDGREVLVPENYYCHTRLGYAVTVHAAQGMTVDEAYVLADQRSINREATYVSISRARHRACVYTDRRSAGDRLCKLVHSMARSIRQPLALEIEGHEQQTGHQRAF